MEQLQTTFSAKDWPFFFSEQLANIPFLPTLWDPTRGNGLGENIAGLLWIRTYQDITSWILFNVFHLTWFFIEITIFWLAFFSIGICSIIFLIRTVFPNRSYTVYFFAAIIFLLNTYILMILSGGQLGILLAYATAPLVVASFIRLTKKVFEKDALRTLIGNWVFCGLSLSMQVMFDPRISYITIFGVFLFILFQAVIFIFNKRYNIKEILSLAKIFVFVFLIPIFLSFCMHAFWLVPYIIYPQNPLSDVTGHIPNVSSVKFFSFADFPHTLSLLHPNWPENIFGKTQFMQPEFIVFPILAFSSLLFFRIVTKPEKQTILFFALLGILGALLAKGAKEPFGFLYLWLFDTFPGFVMFRDPTKWYILVAISYSVLVPFSIYRIYNWIISNIKYKISIIHSKYQIFNFSSVFLIFAFLYFIFLIRPFFLGQLKGTFALQAVPNEYVQLKDFLNDQPNFFRTLWIPQRQRYGFYSYMHPAVSTFDLFKGASLSASLSILKNQVYNGVSLERQFRELGIKYVIIPQDYQGEFFVEDRAYSQRIRDLVKKRVDTIDWLEKKSDFSEITVYELKNANDLFWWENRSKEKLSQSVKWSMIDPTKYKIQLDPSDSRRNLVFAQRYDKNWAAVINSKKVYAKKGDEYKNVFEIPEGNVGIVYIEYELQQILSFTRIFSATILGLCLLLLMRYRKTL